MDQDKLENLVIDDAEQHRFLVNRRVFLDEQVLELERKEIFDRTWLYAAHQSELSEPGAFLTRSVAGKSLLMTCGSDGKISILFNVCPHRGNIICREKAGKAKKFSCFYHSWAFSPQGELIALPDEASYPPNFDKSAMGLKPVPRVETYRGLIFISFDPNICSLTEYFGAAREHIDYFLDFTDDELVVVKGGGQKYSIKSNWKLLAENTVDGYHFLSTHNRFVTHYLPDMGVDTSSWGSWNTDAGKGLNLGNGHMGVEQLQRATGLVGKAKDELDRLQARLTEKFGADYCRRATEQTRNMLIFPNILFISYWKQLRVFYPVSPDYMEVFVWQLAPKNESREVRLKRMEDFDSFLGPTGLGTTDDIAALEGCQRGFRALPDEWSDNSRGMGRTDNDSNSELQMRAFWRRWHALMQGRHGPTDCADRSAAA